MFRNIDALLYGIVCTAVSTVIIDKIMNGTCSGKTVLVITNLGQVMAEEIDRVTSRGATVLRARGGFVGEFTQVYGEGFQSIDEN